MQNIPYMMYLRAKIMKTRELKKQEKAQIFVPKNNEAIHNQQYSNYKELN